MIHSPFSLSFDSYLIYATDTSLLLLLFKFVSQPSSLLLYVFSFIVYRLSVFISMTRKERHAATSDIHLLEKYCNPSDCI